MSLSADQIERLRQELEARQAALREAETSASGTEDVVELDQARQGRLTRMDAMQRQAMSQATGQRRRAELRRIGAALKRIEDGDYGDCLGCGAPIAPGRLAIDPAATRCLPCAEMAER